MKTNAVQRQELAYIAFLASAIRIDSLDKNVISEFISGMREGGYLEIGDAVAKWYEGGWPAVIQSLQKTERPNLIQGAQLLQLATKL